jgi:hypothetical protein
MRRNIEQSKEIDPIVAREELLAGRFEPTPSEIEAARRGTGAKRETSAEARGRLQGKHDEATRRLREKQGEDATGSLKRALERGAK